MFVTPLDVRAVHSGYWRLLADLVWEGKERIVVPAGFVTDLASIPPGLRGVLLQNGRSRRGAVLHDFLYATQQRSRLMADLTFREALRAEGVPRRAQSLYYAGVRMGGKKVWQEYARRGAGIGLISSGS